MSFRKIKLGYYAYFRDEFGRQRTISLHTRDEKIAKKIHAEIMEKVAAAKTLAALRSRHGELFPSGANAETDAEDSPIPAYVPRNKKRLRLDQMIEAASTRRRLSKDHIHAFARFCASHATLRFADEVTPAIGQAYLDARYGAKNGKSYNNTLTMLNVIFKACAVQAGIDKSPFAVIPRRIVDHVEHFRPFTADEFRAIFAAAGEPWKTAALISWHTALRRETCFRISWAHIDEADQSITIMPGKTARFGRAVYIPIHPELWRHLLTLPRPADPKTPILAQWKQHIRYNGDRARDYFAGLLYALGIDDTADGKAGFHSLRASFVTRCDEAGISRRATRGIAGHTDDEMTDLYSHDRETARQILTLPDVLTT